MLTVLLILSFSEHSRFRNIEKAMLPGSRFFMEWSPVLVAPHLVGIGLMAAGCSSIPNVCAVNMSLVVLGLLMGTSAASNFSRLFPRSVQQELGSCLATREAQLPVLPPRVRQMVGSTVRQEGKPFKNRWLVALPMAFMYAASIAAFWGWACRICHSIFILSASVMGFLLGMAGPLVIRRRLHPVFLVVLASWLAAAAWAKLTGSSALEAMATYHHWPGAGAIASCLLGPALASTAVPLRRQLRNQQKRRISGVAALFVSAASSSICIAILVLRLATVCFNFSLSKSDVLRIAASLAGVLGPIMGTQIYQVMGKA
eukprot:TRINITY_DN61638_c0_g1_i1.p1 TRINITY_DN61638_c0_g1~~TRINITY_DN61638_c0_g1_i1.p1  ORF type:complete len:315 (-),score=28.92 TRINITY_DN61638_c0_g1_i1:375-1319(-)